MSQKPNAALDLLHVEHFTAHVVNKYARAWE
jgi:hypothetical protein